MDIDSLYKSPVKLLIYGVFIIITVFSLTQGFQRERVEKDISPFFKGPRPYKSGVTDISDNGNPSGLKLEKKELKFHLIINNTANRYGIDPNLVKAIIMVESRYNPKAVSSKGAMGLMQIMPATATDLGVNDLLDPERNVEAGVKYLKILLNKFDGNLSLTLAAYNAGCTNVKKYRGIPPYKTTRYYVKKVFEYYQGYMQNSKSLGNRI